MNWDREELIGLCVLLAVIVGLSLAGKLTSQAVDGVKFVGGAFMGSKGIQGLLPANKAVLK